MQLHVPWYIVLRSEPSYFNGWIAYNSRTFQTVYLDQFQHAFLEELSVHSISSSEFDSIWPKVGLNSTLTRSDLFEAGIISASGIPYLRMAEAVSQSASRAPTDGSSIHLSTPTQLELCLTRRCDQTCFHCNVSAFSTKRSEQTDTAFWRNVLDQATDCRVLRVTLTGGEPFVRSDIVEILDYLSTKPMGCIILSNAMNLSDPQIAALKNRPISLSVSLDGVNAKQHDTFRRKVGAFDATLCSLRKLRTAGVPFVISSVIHEGNIESCFELLDLAERVGAFRLIVVPMAAVGRAKTKLSQSLFPEAGRLTGVLSELRNRAMTTPGIELIVSNGDPEDRELISITERYSGATAMSRRNPGLCKAGIYSMAVDWDGTAYSCLRGLQERIHPIGSLKEKTLLEVWQSHHWSSFRDLDIPRVPCRVEHIAKMNPEISLGRSHRPNAVSSSSK